MSAFRSNAFVGALVALSTSPLILHGCGGPTETELKTSTTAEVTTITTTDQDTTTTPTTTSTTTTRLSVWNCSTNRKTLQITHPDRKGIAIDDVTMGKCLGNVGMWPHSKDIPTTSLRLFTGWKHGFDSGKREESWNQLKEYVEKTNAKVLFGVEYGKGYDEQSWKWTFELMKLIGPEHTMGVGFGNEVDTDGGWDFFKKDGPAISKIKASVEQMDAAGFQDVPITTVFTAGLIAHIDGKARPFLKQAHELFGDRWVWSFNPYSIWDIGLMNFAKADCNAAVQSATSIKYIQSMTKGIRGKISDLIGGGDFKLWLTEAGWSAPGVQNAGQRSVVSHCGSWASQESLWKMYSGVMEWDLNFDDGTKAADHMFYFTLRDSRGESFGLVSDCGTNDCKIGDDFFSDESALMV